MSRYGMEPRKGHPGSLGLTRFLPGNQSPGRGFFFAEHRERREVGRPASEEPSPSFRWLVPASTCRGLSPEALGRGSLGTTPTEASCLRVRHVDIGLRVTPNK